MSCGPLRDPRRLPQQPASTLICTLYPPRLSFRPAPHLGRPPADNSEYIDQQQLKLQEEPESIPAGEMPRTMLITVHPPPPFHPLTSFQPRWIAKWPESSHPAPV